MSSIIYKLDVYKSFYVCIIVLERCSIKLSNIAKNGHKVIILIKRAWGLLDLIEIISGLSMDKKDTLFKRLTQGLKLDDTNSNNIDYISKLTVSCFDFTKKEVFTNEKETDEKMVEEEKTEYYGLIIMWQPLPPDIWKDVWYMPLNGYGTHNNYSLQQEAFHHPKRLCF